jgi:hypothetical protein
MVASAQSPVHFYLRFLVGLAMATLLFFWSSCALINS